MLPGKGLKMGVLWVSERVILKQIRQIPTDKRHLKTQIDTKITLRVCSNTRLIRQGSQMGVLWVSSIMIFEQIGQISEEHKQLKNQLSLTTTEQPPNTGGCFLLDYLVGHWVLLVQGIDSVYPAPRRLT